ncbi:MAG: hemerythrin domain-containing protein [bacterium]
MTRATERIRRHHGGISKKIDSLAKTLEELRGDDVEGKRKTIEEFVDFLTKELKSHAVGEERYLYPAVEPLVKKHGRATATMEIDHEAIVKYIADFERDAGKLLKSKGAERERALASLKRTAHFIEAVLPLHLEKEERVYLALADDHLTQNEVDDVVEKMHSVHV